MGFFQDLILGWRQMRSHRGFAVAVVVTLALSIGAATAVFGLFDAVLLRPFPYPDPQQLVRIHTYEPGVKGTTRGASIYDFQDYQSQNKSFSAMAEYVTFPNNLTSNGPARVITMTFTSPDLFSLLGVRPLTGRTFLAAEDQIGGDVHKIVLSYGLWRDLFNLDPRVIGKTVQLRGESYTVIGVMPAGFAYPSGTDVWVPLMARYAAIREEWWKRREIHNHEVLARLRPSTSLDQAQADMAIIASHIAAQYPVDRDIKINVQTLREAEAGVLRPYVVVVAMAVLLLLLIGCINVAGLFVARAAERERELAIRMAVGMRRWRLFRQLVAESLLYCVFGCGVGVALAIAGLRAFERAIPVQLPSWMQLRVDARILLFSIGVSLATAMVFGLVPLFQQNELDLNGALKHGARGSSGSTSVARKMRAALVILEVSLSVVLLASAGLMLRSFQKLLHVDTGVQTDHRIVVNLHRYIPMRPNSSSSLAMRISRGW